MHILDIKVESVGAAHELNNLLLQRTSRHQVLEIELIASSFSLGNKAISVITTDDQQILSDTISSAVIWIKQALERLSEKNF